MKPAPLPHAALRSALDEADEALRVRVRAGQDGVSLGARRAEILDGLLRGLFERICGALGVAPGDAPVALAAAGSYARLTLAPCSDVDVRLLVRKRREADAGAFAEALLYPMWDAKLAVGHQLLRPAEVLALAAEDLATATSLLDLRHVAGDAAVILSLREAFARSLEGSKLSRFLERLEADVTARRERFGGSVYLLEPDVKSSEGTLRDLDVARWALRAAVPVARTARDPLDAACDVGIVDGREREALRAAEELLHRVRNHLHVNAGRRADRLTFDAQETLASELGYAGAEELDVERRAEAVERFMQDYYRSARAIDRVRERIFARVRPRPGGRARIVDLGAGVELRGGVVHARHDVGADPPLAFRVYAAALRHQAALAEDTHDAIARAAAVPAFASALRESDEASRLFVELVCTVAEAPFRDGSVVRELHDVGLLLAMVPEFSPVMGRVHHDVYHVFTVDAHSVAALDRLRALARGDLVREHPLASRLAVEIARPRPLFLATLLHDVGKGYPDAGGSRKHHSERGAELCDVVLPRLGFDAEEVVEARELVQQHLTMYHAATRRDLDDAGTLEEMARLVRGREGLRDLYLLTVSDVSTTSPTAMTSWKARMLEELYLRTDALLAGDPGRAFDERTVARAAEEAARALPSSRSEIERFLRSMPMRYLLGTPPSSVPHHLAAVRARGGARVHVALVPSRHDDMAELCVVAADQPGLLARIAAALTAATLEVHAAQVHTRATDGGVEAVDVFFVRDPVDGTAGVAKKLPRLRADLADLCEGRGSPEELLEARTGSRSPWQRRPTPAVASEVVIDDRASPHHTIVEVFGKDQPGLLFRLARAFEELGLSIALSKINTEGTKVADVFYVNELNGSKVEGKERLSAVRDRLLREVA